MYVASEITFNPRISFQNGEQWFEVFQKLEGISVASYFHVYENEDAVSHCAISL
jgi:hypothetical protein